MAAKFGWMKWIVLIFTLSLLMSCGGGGGSKEGDGNPGSGKDPSTISPGSGDGTSTSPVALSIGTPHSGSIGVGGTSYYTFSVSTTGSYTIGLTDSTESLGWFLSTTSFNGAIVDSCSSYSTSSQTCFVSLTAGTTYYLRVVNYSFSSGSYYNVTVSAGGGNEGSIGSPVLLTVGTPRSSTIDNNGDGYYKFTANQSGSFIISLTNTHKDLEWSLYSNATYTTYVVFLCDTTSYPGNEICSTPNLTSGLPYYLKVHNNDYADDTFTITVNNGTSEGSIASPVNLAVGVPHVGGVDTSISASGISYYRFTTDASATSSYNILVSNVTPTANLTIIVYSNASFSTAVATCYGANQCTLSGAAASTPYYVEVQNAASSPARTYTVLVTPGGSEGSPASPVVLTVGQARNASVDVYPSSSYYSFTTLNNGAGGSYTISLTNTQTNLSWTLYSDSAFSSSIGSCDNVTAAGPGNETCATTNLDPNTVYYLKVSNAEAATSTYSLMVVSGGGSEGSLNYPMPIGALHDGGVIKSGKSYYMFTTGSSALTYVISLTNMQTNLSWTLYSNPGFTTEVLWCNQGSGTADEICSTTTIPAGVLSANTIYYLRVDNNMSGNIASTYSLKIEPLDPAAGCSGSAVECFNFEDGLVPTSFIPTSVGTTGNKWKWGNDGSTAGNGTRSMRSGTINYTQSTCFEYTRIATKTVLFSVRTDTNSANDLAFKLDGGSVAWAWWSGSTPWRRVIFDFSNLIGTSHTFSWCYEKGTTTITGADAVWVDDIEFK